MDIDEWRIAADRIVHDLLSMPWEFGDWCIAADDLDVVDERTEILKDDARFEGTLLAHYAYVSERITATRRRALPWSYHEAVARLPVDVQDALFDLAEIEAWTLQEIRRASREAAKELA